MLERELTKLAGENWQVCIFKLNQYLSSLINFFYRTGHWVLSALHKLSAPALSSVLQKAKNRTQSPQRKEYTGKADCRDAHEECKFYNHSPQSTANKESAFV